MERRTNLDVFGVLNSVLYDELFLESLGWQTERMDKFIQSSLIAEFAREVESRGKDGALFSSVKVEELAREYVLSLREAPPEGWLKYCFDVTESNLFPETKKRDESLDDRYGEGRLILLQILRGLYKYEDEVLPFHPERTMRLLSRDTGGNTWREYLRFRDVIRSEYIYEFLRIARDITPFDTLGHMAGVHYVAMYMAYQLKEAGVPVDLPLISGAAAGHDIGKFGCRHEEEGRIPYLHYYYTDICYKRFGLDNMGHIAANHSTWDLELENLSVESLLLIYADFRVKTGGRIDGSVGNVFYTLKQSFDVILRMLDNVDEAKEARYRKVYAKLKDFESYMNELGVTTTLPQDLNDEVPELKPIYRERALLEGDMVVEQLKYSAIEHNIKLMSILHVDSELADLIEAARSETTWKNVRTYIGIFDEYSTYMSERQKLMTLRFLYELLAHKENDIRIQAGTLMGVLTSGFTEKYKKEIPVGAILPEKSMVNVNLFEDYVDKIIYPERRFTEQHRGWMRGGLGDYLSSVLKTCREESRPDYIGRLTKYYNQDITETELAIVLMGILDRLEQSWCPPDFVESAKDLITECLGSDKQELRLASLRAERHFLKDMSEDEYYHALLDIMGFPHQPEEILEREGSIFLDDLKMGTHWLVKVANIQIMRHFGKRSKTPGVVLHLGTHLVNLLKVNERAEVRRAAGNALLDLMPLMPDAQRNELAVELYNGLEIGDRQFAKNIPYYLGKLTLALPPAEFDETIDTIETSVLKTSIRVSAFMIESIGVMLENYADFANAYPAPKEEHDARKVRLLYIMIKAYGHFDSQFSRDAFRDIGKYIFASDILPEEDKVMLFTRSYKKILQLLDESSEDMLRFYSNAAVLNHIYRYIGNYQHEHGNFNFRIPERVCFYPGTFDPFSLAHKAVAMRIRDMGFDVYLALDEFSWSKHTQPKLLRRKIMNISTAGEEGIYSFPDDIPVNIANNYDIRRLKDLFADKDIYIAVGSDVIKNASAYLTEPQEDSVHSLSHIIFERETRENRNEIQGETYPISGDVIQLTLDKFYEDISSTRIRENIDLNRDVSNIIDIVAQSFIYENNMYLREPTYKHVIESQEIEISTLESRSPDTLDSIFYELDEMGYDMDALQEYIGRDSTKCIYILDTKRNNKVIAYAACHKVGTRELLSEFESETLAGRVRSMANGSVYAIGFFYFDPKCGISDIGQMLITELTSGIIARDHAYAVYHPLCDTGRSASIYEALARQGFIDITGEIGDYPAIYDDDIKLYAVSMDAPVVVFKDVETVIKSPLNKSPIVLSAIEDAHNNLLETLAKLYPGRLLLSFNTGAMQNKIIGKACYLNGVSTVNGATPKGPYMAVPFGKTLGDVLIPNTVTKPLEVEKYFNRNIQGFTIEEAKNYSPLKTQAKMIRSFNRPIILIDDLLHKGHRIKGIEPILEEAGCEVKEVLVGVMTGYAMDRMESNNVEVECAYFLPTLEIWLNERDCYPFIGGDSLQSASEDKVEKGSASANLILPYIKPGFLKDGDEEAAFIFSEVCLKNARRIMAALENEYQKEFERKLTLKRIGEVITIPKIPETDRGVTFDENREPTNFLDNDIERLSRLKW